MCSCIWKRKMPAMLIGLVGVIVQQVFACAQVEVGLHATSVFASGQSDLEGAGTTSQHLTVQIRFWFLWCFDDRWIWIALCKSKGVISAECPVYGYDLNAHILDWVADGTIAGTVDQQPYRLRSTYCDRTAIYPWC